MTIDRTDADHADDGDHPLVRALRVPRAGRGAPIRRVTPRLRVAPPGATPADVQRVPAAARASGRGGSHVEALMESNLYPNSAWELRDALAARQWRAAGLDHPRQRLHGGPGRPHPVHVRGGRRGDHPHPDLRLLRDPGPTPWRQPGAGAHQAPTTPSTPTRCSPPSRPGPRASSCAHPTTPRATAGRCAELERVLATGSAGDRGPGVRGVRLLHPRSRHSSSGTPTSWWPRRCPRRTAWVACRWVTSSPIRRLVDLLLRLAHPLQHQPRGRAGLPRGGGRPGDPRGAAGLHQHGAGAGVRRPAADCPP